MARCLSLGVCLILAGFSGAQSPTVPVVLTPAEQDAAYIKTNYTKYEYRIPMRDGVKLHTHIYIPKDNSQKYPVMLFRTPYSVSPYGIDNIRGSLGPHMGFAKAGYIFAYQDVRGRWMSEGTFENVRPQNPKKVGAKDIDESSDTYDTIEWLMKNVPNHNGKVGQSGISYPGFYTTCGAIDAHPALVAASPQAPVGDWFIGDDFHHNGAFFLTHAFNFMAGFGKARPEPTKKFGRPTFEHGTPDGYDFFLELGPLRNADLKHFKGDIAFWNTMMDHPNYDDFWQARDMRPHIKDIKPALLTVGGWFDAEDLFGALETFRCADVKKPGGPNHLVMGPWNHGGWSRAAGDTLGDLNFATKTGEYYRDQVELPFFEFHLKGKGTPKIPKALVFETGTNLWKHYDSWPPSQSVAKSFFLREAGQLSDTASSVDGAKDTYFSDPSRPVPYVEKTTPFMPGDYMTYDQRFASRRTDVLTYKTDVLSSDVTLSGPVEVELWVSTTGTDADFVVKLIDVFPGDYPDGAGLPAGVRMGGYQMLVRGEPFRGKYRNSFSKPEPFEPGKPTLVKFTMPDICHTFRPGHRVMVQVQSSWFPLVDRNPQTFCDIYKAKEEDFKAQTHTVYHTAKEASKVTIRMVK